MLHIDVGGLTVGDNENEIKASAKDEPIDVPVTDLIVDDRQKYSGTKGVLVIYSGGTIGSAPRDRSDPDSPQIVVNWEELKRSVPGLNDIPFRLDAISFKTALDSSNVGPKHWKTLASIIQRYYNDYAGFVIAHGTDTMVYTASALSFILKNLHKPVIITGSQISGIDKIRNDAQQNLITALLIANPSSSRIPVVPEVCIFFRDRLLRGSRSRKIDASGFTAFDSPNCLPLAMAGDKIVVNRDVVRKISTRDFRIQPDLDTNVIAFDIFPGLQDNMELFRAILETKKLRGVVLKTYGAGNIPTEPPDLLNELKKAVDKGIIIVNVTQCIKGDVEQGLYDTSAVLQDIGVISGQDITPEAALCKLMELVGDPDSSEVTKENLAKIKGRMTQNIAGELDYSIYYTTIDNHGGVIVSSKEDGRHRFPGARIEGLSASKSIEKVLMRFIGAEVLDTDKVRLKIYVNLGLRERPEENPKRCGGVFTKQRETSKQTFTFDISPAKAELGGGDDISFTIILESAKEGGLRWDKVELALFTKE
jgi:L-asparaginase